MGHWGYSHGNDNHVIKLSCQNRNAIISKAGPTAECSITREIFFPCSPQTRLRYCLIEKQVPVWFHVSVVPINELIAK